jgi:hypothetical protein
MSISAAVVASADFSLWVDSQGGIGYSSFGKDASTGDRFIIIFGGEPHAEN